MNAYKDLVLETSTTTGTGTLTLAGAVLGHQAFSVVGDGATCEYLIRQVDPVTGALIGPFEIGVGTYSASAHTLTRGATVSSNGGAAVPFVGTLRVSLITSSATVGSLLASAIQDGFATVAAMNAYLATNGTSLVANQSLVVATEPLGVVRRWNGTNALNLSLPGGKRVVLAANTNTVIATTGVPASGTGNSGDVALDVPGNRYYTKGASTWGAGVNITAVATAARPAQIIIAASDSAGNAADADFLCTGTVDDATIQLAVTQIRGIPGKILFRAGTYNLTNEILIDTSWLTLEAESYGFWNKYAETAGPFTFPRSTPGNPGGALFKQATSGKGVWRVGTNYFNGDNRHKAINFIKLSHYGPTGTSVAIVDMATTDISHIDGCNFQGFAGAIDVSWDNPIIRDNNVQDTAGGNNSGPPAVRVSGFRAQILGNTIFQVGNVGLWVAANDSLVSGNNIGYSNACNLLISNAGATVTGNNIVGVPGNGVDGILIGNYTNAGAKYSQPSDRNIIVGNRITMTLDDSASPVDGSGGGSGINVGGDGGTPRAYCSYNVINSNYISTPTTGGTKTGYAIKMNNGSDWSSVQGNTIQGAWNSGSSTKIYAGSGPNNKIMNNAGTA